MSQNRSSVGLRDPEAFYQALIEAHEGLDAEQSRLLDARLILLMANELGDDDRVAELVRLAAAEGSARR